MAAVTPVTIPLTIDRDVLAEGIAQALRSLADEIAPKPTDVYGESTEDPRFVVVRPSDAGLHRTGVLDTDTGRHIPYLGPSVARARAEELNAGAITFDKLVEREGYAVNHADDYPEILVEVAE